MTEQSVLADPYLSRGDHESVIDRKDPVVYCERPSVSGTVLSDNQLSFFERNGFIVFDSLFTEEEVTKFKDELNQLRSDKAAKNNEEYYLEPSSEEVRSIFNIHRTNKIFQRLSREDRILRVVTKLLNSSVYMHQSRINYKPGLEGKEFYWHSDFETWHAEDGMPRMRAISCSITLTDNNEFNGPLMLIPGSHKYFIACAGQTPENHYKHSLKKQEYGVPSGEILKKLADQNGIVSFKGKAGSAIFFDCNTMHGSNGNISPWARSNVFFVYNSVLNSLVDPFCGLQPRPDFIASRDFSPLKPF